MMEKKEIQLPLAAFKLDVNNSGQPEEGQEISDTGPSRLRWRSAATLCTISRILPLNESRWCEERQPSPLSAGRVSLQHFYLFQFVSLVCCCYGIISPASILLILLFLFVFHFFPPTVFASPSLCSLHFLPPNFHHLIPVTGSSAEQCCAPWPRLFFGRVMYEWLALTSLQAQRHSNSVLPGLLFLVLSFTASPSFLFLCILH